MWQHCNNISCWEYKTELTVDEINQLINTLSNDNDILRFTVILRSCVYGNISCDNGFFFGDKVELCSFDSSQIIIYLWCFEFFVTNFNYFWDGESNGGIRYPLVSMLI
jgi:hypothetical protein